MSTEPANTPPPPSPSLLRSHPATGVMHDSTSTVWDFADLLDFTSDDHLFPNLWDPSTDGTTSTTTPAVDPDPDILPPPADSMARTRKRDPRLVCSNFLAGRVPCVCPEIDEKLEVLEGLRLRPKKKRTRTQRAGSGVTTRCQVPGCEEDISELKGYHRRHRVCLSCANAPSVVLNGETKRYCQQCGKFHVLSDFDEGKRSCRRKLERHNNRRRRKLVNSDNVVGKEFQHAVNSVDVPCEDEDEKGLSNDFLCSSNHLGEKEASLEPEDRQVSPPCSAPEFQTVNHSDSAVSFVVSRDIQAIGPKHNPNPHSPSHRDSRGAYSSVCPTGRISFKLYDWNPAEFPRHLRLQVLQWLSNMPIELEGYIRPGCTILTMFIAMPKIMWEKLCEDPVSSIQDFIVQPGSALPARSTFFVHLNNMVFCVLKGGSSVVEVKVADRAPRLHYVSPMCFEVGKPTELVACGSNLLQSKSRFLISFSGKYLPCESCLVSPEYGSEQGNDHDFQYQFYKIRIPRTHPDLFGPAFIEVENESGLSNFIPVLFGDKEVCSEVRKIQQIVDNSFSNRDSDFVGTNSSCKTSISGQTAISEFLVDIGWLLKETPSENLHCALSASQIQRLTCLLSFLIENESTVILETVLQILQKLMDEFEVKTGNGGLSGADVDVFKTKVEFAREFLRHKLQKIGGPMLCSEFSALRYLDDVLSSAEVNQEMEMRENRNPGPVAAMTCADREDAVPLLDFEGSKRETLIKKKPSRQIFFPLILRSRSAHSLVATAAVCFGICAVLLHSHKRPSGFVHSDPLLLLPSEQVMHWSLLQSYNLVTAVTGKVGREVRIS